MKHFQNNTRSTRVHHNAQSNMKPKQHLTAPLGILALLLTCILAAPAAHGAAATSHPPERMTYQGYLVDANGVPLGNTAPINTSVIFRIWKVATGSVAANRMWTEQQTVTIDKGYFSVVLGDGNQFETEAHGDLSAVFSGSDASDRFLGLTIPDIMGANELLPRITLVPSPYAFLARYANGIADDANGEFALTNTTSALRITKTIQTLGGNARGTQAVDMQDNRSSNSQVASGNYSVVSGGRRNTASGADSVVGGGYQNVASGNYSAVPGGLQNTASGLYSFAAGRAARAQHQGSFVWADSGSTTFSSSGNNQFLVKASGGVGINTANATLMSGNALTVSGNAEVTGTLDVGTLVVDNITQTGGIIASGINDNTITSAKIVNGTITKDDLGANSVDSSELVNGSIDPGHIGSGAFSFDRVVGKAVGVNGSFSLYDKDNVLTANMDSDGRFGYRANASSTSFNVRAKSGDATAFMIESSTGTDLFKVLPNGNVSITGTINAAAIPGNAINSARIANGTITKDDLGADSVDSSELVDGSIDPAHIGSGQFDFESLTVNAVGGLPLLKLTDENANLVLNVDSNERFGFRATHSATTFNIMMKSGDSNILRLQNAAGTERFRVESSGDTYVKGSLVHSSDRRLKTAITPFSDLLPKLMTLEPSEYRFLSDNPTRPKRIGFIAQDVERAFPNAVEKNGEYLALDYNAFGVIAIKAIQEQQALIEDKDERIAALEKRLSDQEAANAARDTRLTKLEQRLERLLAAAGSSTKESDKASR